MKESAPPLSRETSIRRNAEGRWFHDGEPVLNPAVARAFDRWVSVAEDGRMCLENEVNWAYVEIEGAPLFVDRVHWNGASPTLQLSDGREEALAPRTLRQDRDGKLYCTAREGRLTAEFRRSAMFDLSDALGEDDRGVFLVVGSGSARVWPPVVDDPFDPRFSA